MSDQFLGEIRIFAGNFAIYGWAFCNGQLLPISQNTALFSLLGTYYGGNGTSNFALPNLQGCAPLGAGNGPGLTPHVVGETGGESTVTLLNSQMPAHAHGVAVYDGAGNADTPAGAVFAKAHTGKTPVHVYNSTTDNSQMNTLALSPIGGNQPHNNMAPYLGLNFIIAMTGVFPSRS